MNILNTNSLAETLDNLNEAFSSEYDVPLEEARKTALWIAGRHGIKGSYAQMPAPTALDYANPIRLFTGEKISSRVGRGHILGQEACRALIKLNVKHDEIAKALSTSSATLLHRIVHNHEEEGGTFGMYCCGTCTPALWRHLNAGGLDRQEERTVAGVKVLMEHRDGNGKWRRFPFYWTLLALSEMKHVEAIDEMKYTAPVLERYVKRKRTEDKYAVRRRMLAKVVLEKIN